jgi:hypothetical protein
LQNIYLFVQNNGTSNQAVISTAGKFVLKSTPIIVTLSGIAIKV